MTVQKIVRFFIVVCIHLCLEFLIFRCAERVCGGMQAIKKIDGRLQLVATADKVIEKPSFAQCLLSSFMPVLNLQCGANIMAPSNALL